MVSYQDVSCITFLTLPRHLMHTDISHIHMNTYILNQSTNLFSFFQDIFCIHMLIYLMYTWTTFLYFFFWTSLMVSYKDISCINLCMHISLYICIFVYVNFFAYLFLDISYGIIQRRFMYHFFDLPGNLMYTDGYLSHAYVYIHI